MHQENNHRYREQYDFLNTSYKRLGKNIREALETFLGSSNISVLAVTYRIKEFDSFIEKIERKKYTDPFKQIEDICGIRVICYYQTDVEKICNIIKKEFDIKESQDKEDLLNDDQFGYRSYHLIGKIKKTWLKAPNYRGLENLKFEIQVRTVLMHAWDEIEHELAYKQKVHIPPHLKRKLYRISAKLEEADEQFEDIKKESTEYRNSIITSAKSQGGIFDKEMKLNLDSFQAFLDFKFPKRKRVIEDTRALLDEMIESKVSFKELQDYLDKTEKYLDEIEKESFSSEILTSDSRGWAQTGLIRTVLDICSKNYFNSRKKNIPYDVKVQRNKWQKIINN